MKYKDEDNTSEKNTNYT